MCLVWLGFSHCSELFSLSQTNLCSPSTSPSAPARRGDDATARSLNRSLKGLGQGQGWAGAGLAEGTGWKDFETYKPTVFCTKPRGPKQLPNLYIN